MEPSELEAGEVGPGQERESGGVTEVEREGSEGREGEGHVAGE